MRITSYLVTVGTEEGFFTRVGAQMSHQEASFEKLLLKLYIIVQNVPTLKVKYK